MNYIFPPKPTSVRELMDRIRVLIASATPYIIPEEKEYGCGGNGGPGELLQLLTGVDGGNKDNADCYGVELKYISVKRRAKLSSCLLTLFHKDPHGGVNALLPLVKALGRTDHEGCKSFRHTLSARSLFQVTSTGLDIIVQRPDLGLKVVWTEEALETKAARKLEDVILVPGSLEMRGGNRIVVYQEAIRLTDFSLRRFIQSIVDRKVLIDFDMREQYPDATVLRNHGTKFRIKLKDSNHVWRDIQHIAVAPGIVPLSLATGVA